MRRAPLERKLFETAAGSPPAHERRAEGPRREKWLKDKLSFFPCSPKGRQPWGWLSPPRTDVCLQGEGDTALRSNGSGVGVVERICLGSACCAYGAEPYHLHGARRIPTEEASGIKRIL